LPTVVKGSSLHTWGIRRKLQWIANTLVNFFHSRGIKVMRYDAFSTNSIYLKLDYGLLYSIRLSDHPGKQHLNYRFNAVNKYDGPRQVPTDWNWNREFYTLDTSELNEMCRSILSLQADKMQQLGAYGYQNKMEQHEQELERKLAYDK